MEIKTLTPKEFGLEENKVATIEHNQIKQLHEERKNKAIPYYQFWSEFEKRLNFGEQSDADFEAFMQRNITAKRKFDEEQNKMQKELENLKTIVWK